MVGKMPSRKAVDGLVLEVTGNLYIIYYGYKIDSNFGVKFPYVQHCRISLFAITHVISYSWSKKNLVVVGIHFI